MNPLRMAFLNRFFLSLADCVPPAPNLLRIVVGNPDLQVLDHSSRKKVELKVCG